MTLRKDTQKMKTICKSRSQNEKKRLLELVGDI